MQSNNNIRIIEKYKKIIIETAKTIEQNKDYDMKV